MIRVEADSAKWEAELQAKFASLEKRLNAGMPGVVSRVRSSVIPTVKRTLVRPEVFRGHAGIAQAIEASTYVSSQLASVTMGDAKILDQLAIYWRALEFGSSHIIGHMIFGFAGQSGVNAPNAARFRQDSDTVSASTAQANGIPFSAKRVVRRGIPTHHILSRLSVTLVKLFTAEVGARFDEAFAGTPYKQPVVE